MSCDSLTGSEDEQLMNLDFERGEGRQCFILWVKLHEFNKKTTGKFPFFPQELTPGIWTLVFSEFHNIHNSLGNQQSLPREEKLFSIFKT